MASKTGTKRRKSPAGKVTRVAKTTKTTRTTKATETTAPQHSWLSRLYTGTGAFEVIGKRRLWYAVSAAMMAVSVASIALLWFNFGIDFAGGSKVSFPRSGAEISQVQEVYHKALGSDPESVVFVGKGDSESVQIRTQHLDNDQTDKLRDALFSAFHPKGGDGQPSEDVISESDVSASWGQEVTSKAGLALGVFLLLAALYVTVRYERYMMLAAMASMVFDVVVTAGIYSLVGFEVTPATVIGLLTILGFSIYDTVIVFDKVEENTHGFEHTTRRTFAEQANLAVNQTFMRSINTSLISVLPVLALMVVAVLMLGVGTLKDLALIQLVGIIVGTYSSIFFATPLLVTMRERTELVRVHTRRVLRRRERGTGRDADEPDFDESDVDAADEADESDATPDAVTETVEAEPAAVTRTRPARPTRPSGKHSR